MAASATSREVSRSGSPQVMYATKPGCFLKRIAIGCGPLELQILPQNPNVFIAAAGNVDDNDVRLCHAWRALHDLCDGVSGFQRGNDSFQASQRAASVERLLVAGRDIFGAPLIVQPGVLRPYRRIIQTSRNRMGRGDLPRLVLQHVGIRSLQHARAAAVETRGVLAQRVATSSRLDANQFHLAVLQELVEKADCVRTAADAGDERSWQPALGFENLLASLLADDAVEVAHHGRVRMRS